MKSIIILVTCCLAAAAIVSAAPSQWAHAVFYSDDKCTEWQEASSLPVGCTQQAYYNRRDARQAPFTKVSCASSGIVVLKCQDSECTDCSADSAYSTFKSTCSAVSATQPAMFGKVICSSNSVPFPEEKVFSTQFLMENATCAGDIAQILSEPVGTCRRRYNSKRTISCTDALISIRSDCNDDCSSCNITSPTEPMCKTALSINYACGIVPQPAPSSQASNVRIASSVVSAFSVAVLVLAALVM